MSYYPLVFLHFVDDSSINIERCPADFKTNQPDSNSGKVNSNASYIRNTVHQIWKIILNPVDTISPLMFWHLWN